MLTPFKLATFDPRIPTPNPFKLHLPLKFNNSITIPLMLSELFMKLKSIPLYLVKPPKPNPTCLDPNERCILLLSILGSS